MSYVWRGESGYSVYETPSGKLWFQLWCGGMFVAPQKVGGSTQTQESLFEVIGGLGLKTWEKYIHVNNLQ